MSKENFIYTEQLPPQAIKGIVVNHDAYHLLSYPSDRWILDTDTLVQWAKITIPPIEEEKTNPIYSHPEEGRGIPLDYVNIRYGENFRGYCIMGKGQNIAGFYYRNLVYENGLAFTERNPWGFIGDTDAATDMQVASTFIQEGIRFSLPIALIYVDPDYIRQRVQNAWGNYSPEILQRSIDRVVKDDYLVQEIRLAGIRPRIGTIVLPFYEQRIQYDPQLLNSVRNTYQLFLQESHEFPQLFKRYGTIGNGRSLPEIQTLFQQIINNTNVNDALFFDYLLGMFGHTAKKMIAMNNNYPDSVRNYLTQGDVDNFGWKDIDLLGTLYDCESSVKKYPQSTKELIINWTTRAIINYQALLLELGMIKNDYNFEITKAKIKSLLYT